ncbi:phycobilisome phycoerythrin-associated linker polypeptide CpeE [Geminocystis sp. NIES-3708]|uniref:phycobilisome rod-core linker polypeptide n=1 Tax=Geminocystis sp. NIES-3708 TaxID=1615909 RepID=UPI0005FCB0A5|nr:phycobilisome rod-core linker polypeptide [Geminocystis sp. NIES-3708]BAQ61082.1 phycobilisome phycoerythrin-associated linker polypeptide CpeE [Geminocystis sp. NIES-3708]
MASLTEAFINNPIELWANNTEDDLQLVIRAVYKQVLGNAHVMESERLESAESMLRNGNISLRNFVRMVGQSELYQSLFFNSSSAYRFIELNCKHFLGRAPLNQEEISEHVQIYNEQGYEAEINSYIDSEEYNRVFGENIVPFPRNITSQKGVKNVVFNRTISLLGGLATSDNSNKAQLTNSIGANLSPQIKVKSSGIEKAHTNTGKRFKISVRKSGTTPLFKQSNITYTVGYSQLSPQIQNIQKKGGQILSIVEV